MDKVIEILASWIPKNFRKPKFYIVIVFLVIAVALVFPYVDANFFFYGRMEKRADILLTLSEVDPQKIAQSPMLEEEYQSLLKEMEKQREFSISYANATDTEDENVPLFKFLSGGIPAWIIMLLIPFMNTFESKKQKFFAFVLMLIGGAAFGGAGCIFPTVFNPWFNYIGWPAIQIFILIAILTKKDKTNS